MGTELKDRKNQIYEPLRDDAGTPIIRQVVSRNEKILYLDKPFVSPSGTLISDLSMHQRETEMFADIQLPVTIEIGIDASKKLRPNRILTNGSAASETAETVSEIITDEETPKGDEPAIQHYIGQRIVSEIHIDPPEDDKPNINQGDSGTVQSVNGDELEVEFDVLKGVTIGIKSADVRRYGYGIPDTLAHKDQMIDDLAGEISKLILELQAETERADKAERELQDLLNGEKPIILSACLGMKEKRDRAMADLWQYQQAGWTVAFESIIPNPLGDLWYARLERKPDHDGLSIFDAARQLFDKPVAVPVTPTPTDAQESPAVLIHQPEPMKHSVNQVEKLLDMGVDAYLAEKEAEVKAVGVATRNSIFAALTGTPIPRLGVRRQAVSNG